ncbi:nicotinate (nicotinamide) nucleotide adenylyltransferase [Stieleria sp. JC731]|uniref:nicotinate (nicotinamide) nucleotide adenylyltransferase n=1 Tax=Pirellulaceae TaxID=2691357 RepID=UPI001E4CAA20|nr:nicotinate (nicotinamide) nucleotide adenylyltransferase [Stieleria sp. JC731]MCC9599562.1 nicotinate (nicotinamide) nucleotide adenylyltransferase [Stieleria sp. JC731]
MRLGIFGGSFDPVHLGHLWIGEAAMESLNLDRLHWIPTAEQPLKPGGAVATADQRAEMVRLAVSGRDGFVMDDREIRRQGVSYSVDTIDEIAQEFPSAELFLVIGSDSLASMQKWHQPEKLLSLVQLAVVQRGGEPPIDFSVLDRIIQPSRIELFRANVIEMPIIEISSREIRDRVRSGRTVRYRVPHAVQAFIKASRLYLDSSP